MDNNILIFDSNDKSKSISISEQDAYTVLDNLISNFGYECLIEYFHKQEYHDIVTLFVKSSSEARARVDFCMFR